MNLIRRSTAVFVEASVAAVIIAAATMSLTPVTANAASQEFCDQLGNNMTNATDPGTFFGDMIAGAIGGCSSTAAWPTSANSPAPATAETDTYDPSTDPWS